MKKKAILPMLVIGGAAVLGLGALLIGGGSDHGEPVLSGSLLGPQGPATWRVFEDEDGVFAEFTLPQDGGTIEMTGGFESAEQAAEAVQGELERRGFFPGR